MRPDSIYPSLYQVNTRAWLRALGDHQGLGRTATLDDVEDAELDGWARLGFDWIWLLGVWRSSSQGRSEVAADPEWRRILRETLPDLRDEDICGSCFSITGYSVRDDIGGDEALARFRERLNQRGMRLLADFVPNHTAVDHPWVREQPALYVHGAEEDLSRAPWNYRRVATATGSSILAHGRDPHFPGWRDTFQLNYGNPELQGAMASELVRIAGAADGVRCDMAMLLLPEVFQRTWGIQTAPFWPNAITEVKRDHPDFLFIAEAYWDLEETLQQQGFDYTYDKRLYDHLRDGRADLVRTHLQITPDFQRRSVRFLENHDEPRATTVFAPATHRAAAAITYLAPGLRLFHQGQLEGRRVRLPMQLCRWPSEMPVASVHESYDRLLALLRTDAVRRGEWQLLERVAAWDGNGSWESLIAFLWERGEERVLVCVNFSASPCQCYVRLPLSSLPREADWELTDEMSDARYIRAGAEIAAKGLFLDLPPYGLHAFQLRQLA